jgi:hypothetical protein
MVLPDATKGEALQRGQATAVYTVHNPTPVSAPLGRHCYNGLRARMT